MQVYIPSGVTQARALLLSVLCDTGPGGWVLGKWRFLSFFVGNRVVVGIIFFLPGNGSIFDVYIIHQTDTPMLKRILMPALLILMVFSGCKEKEAEPAYEFNISATTWKGTYKQGSSSFYNYTFIFLAGGTLEGNLNLTGSPQKITGTWIQDKNKVSTNYAVAGYAGTWRGEVEISENKKELQYKGIHSTSNVLDFSFTATLH